MVVKCACATWDLFKVPFVRSPSKAFQLSDWKVIWPPCRNIQCVIKWLQFPSAEDIWHGTASARLVQLSMITSIWLFPVSVMQIFWWYICTTSLISELSTDLRGNFKFHGSFTCKHAFIRLSQGFLNPGQSNLCNFLLHFVHSLIFYLIVQSEQHFR